MMMRRDESMNECMPAVVGDDGRRTKDARRDDDRLDDVDDVDRLASVWTSTTVDDEGIIMVIVVVDRRGGGWMWTRGTIGRRTVVAR